MQRFKRGDVHPETGMIFSHYKGTGREQWYSTEAWNKRIQTQKEFNKTQRSKDYQKEWYERNKDLKLMQSKINRQNRIEEFPLKALLSSVKSGARLRNLTFDIDYKFVQYLWEKQNGRCFYSNVEMKLIAMKKDPFQVSIDRINSSLGYTHDNVVLCCQCINYMKNDYSLDSFNLFLKSLTRST